MWLWPVVEMTELVTAMSAAQLGMNLHECEDQSWFSAPLFRLDWSKMSPRTLGGTFTPG
jgi:hypothetical protein